MGEDELTIDDQGYLIANPLAMREHQHPLIPIVANIW